MTDDHQTEQARGPAGSGSGTRQHGNGSEGGHEEGSAPALVATPFAATMVAPAPGSECSSLSAKRQRCDDAPEALSGWSPLPPTKTLALLLSGRPIPIQIRRRDARPCWPPLALKPTRCSAVGALGGGAARSCGAQLAGPRARPAQKCFSWCTGGVDNSACAPGYRRTPWAGVALAVTLAKRTTLLIRARCAQTLARRSIH